MTTPPVAVVGAGIAGLAAARRLHAHGLSVRVFEKSRGLGGRAATRRSGRLAFDHGAQYFTVREPELAEAIEPLLQRGRIARWEPRIVRITATGERRTAGEAERFVGVPGMSMVGRALAGEVVAARGTRIVSLSLDRSGRWRLGSAEGRELGPFSAVVVTCPSPQAADLLTGVSPDLASACRAVEMQPCWSVMAAFDEPLDLDLDAAFVEDEALAWAAREASKPERVEVPECWTLHAGPAWSAARLEETARRVGRDLLDRFFELVGAPPRSPVELWAHRWRFARSREPRDGDPLVDVDARLGVAGDWTRGDRLEGAFMSGLETADAIGERIDAQGG